MSGEAEITCVGIFSAIAEGENIEASGDYTDHPTYGKQFKVESFEEKAPEDEEAIERYLGSGAIRGIGLALAARIVRRFKAVPFGYRGGAGAAGGSKGNQRAQGDGDCGSGE